MWTKLTLIDVDTSKEIRNIKITESTIISIDELYINNKLYTIISKRICFEPDKDISYKFYVREIIE